MTSPTQWDDYPVIDPGDITHHVRVSENGFGMLIAWAAGPHRAVRVPATPSDYPPVTQTTRTGGQPPTTTQRERTVSEQQELDDDIDQYLNDAGIPPHPRGYTWHVQVHPGDTDTDLGRALGATNSVEPAAVAHELRDRYELYLRPRS